MKILKNYINGEFIDSTTSRFIEFMNPALDEPLGKIPISTRERNSVEGIKNIDLRLSALEDMEVARLATEVAAKLWGKFAPDSISLSASNIVALELFIIINLIDYFYILLNYL